MLEVEELRSLDMTVMVENPLLILVSFLSVASKDSFQFSPEIAQSRYLALEHCHKPEPHCHNTGTTSMALVAEIRLIYVFMDRSCHYELILHQMVKSR